jgi:hypothetical protein
MRRDLKAQHRKAMKKIAKDWDKKDRKPSGRIANGRKPNQSST